LIHVRHIHYFIRKKDGVIIAAIYPIGISNIMILVVFWGDLMSV